MEDKPKKRNWLVVHAKQRKAGAHTSKKYTRKTKHKGKDDGIN